MFEAKVPPPTYQRRDDAEGHWVETLLAYDSGDARAVYLRSALAPMPEAAMRCFEFTFDIYVVSGSADREPFGVQDGRQSRPFLPAAIRPLVLEYVLDGLEMLIDDVGPKAIYRVTKSSELPEKAMKKHDLITERLARLGYAVTETGADPAYRTYWLMGRLEY
jgi:hypothetical protein